MIRRAVSNRGFSLLELLVALAILGLVLGTLYRAATGATRNVAVAERYSFAVLLAQSLLSDYAGRTGGGLNASGSSGGYSWSIRGTAQPGNLRDGQALQRVTATVTWEGGGNSEVELTTIVPMPKKQVAE